MRIQEERSSFLSADFVSCVGLQRGQVSEDDFTSFEDQLPWVSAGSVLQYASTCLTKRIVPFPALSAFSGFKICLPFNASIIMNYLA